MMQIKTSELVGNALDWAVAKCEGYDMTMAATCGDRHGIFFLDRDDCLRYTTNWKQGGPIIEAGKLHICPDGDRWVAHQDGQMFGYGDTPLVAAMRCYVASKLGETVDIPEDICK